MHSGVLCLSGFVAVFSCSNGTAGWALTNTSEFKSLNSTSDFYNFNFRLGVLSGIAGGLCRWGHGVAQGSTASHRELGGGRICGPIRLCLGCSVQ